MKSLVLLTGLLQTSEERRLLGLAAWMGVSTKVVTLQQGREYLLDELQSGLCCLSMSAETLVALYKALASATEFRQLIHASRAELLVFGFSDSLEQMSALSCLTDGLVCGMNLLDDPNVVFTFPLEAKGCSQQLAGLRCRRRNTDAIPVFDLRNATSGVETIVSVNARPMFVRIHQEPLQIFLLAGSGLLDIDVPLSRDRKMQDYFDRLVPVMIFLRYSFTDRCWHGPEPTARLIIDDPLLTEKYGFLDYNVLLKSMQHAKYGTSVAFIPWNYWRTSRRAVSQIYGEGSNLSICVHGCDHTNKEFQAQDQVLLGRKAALALTRMESQRQRTGVNFERVMIFPQGRFSKAAISALRAHNYLAVVNSTCFPTDSEVDDITVGESLRPAVTRYDGFPIFIRRYPQSLFDSAIDIFLGRPALLVEHHEFFRNGYGTLEKFVAELNKVEPALSWPDLTTQLMQSCLRKSISNGLVEVRFFTRKFQMHGCDRGSGRFLLSKHEPNSAAITKVLVNGASIPFSFEKDFLKFEVEADDQGQVLNIEIVEHEQPRQRFNDFGIIHNSGVMLRRALSELRDNTLARHVGLLKMAKGVARGLKVTGDS